MFSNVARYNKGFLGRKGTYSVKQVLSKVKGDAFLSEFFRHTIDLAKTSHEVFLDEFHSAADEFKIVSVPDVYLDFIDFKYGHLEFVRDIEVEMGNTDDLDTALYDWFNKGLKNKWDKFIEKVVDPSCHSELINSTILADLMSLLTEVEPEESSLKRFWIPYFGGMLPYFEVKGRNLAVISIACQYHLIDYPIWDYLEDKVNAYF